MRNAGKGAKDHDSCGALTQHKAIGKTYSNLEYIQLDRFSNIWYYYLATR